MTKGGKKRIKQPGTPLLTLDGQIILDFESSEEHVARRRGAEAQSTTEKMAPQTEKEKKPTRRINLSTDDEATSGVYIHQQAKPFKPTPTPLKTEDEALKKTTTAKTVVAKMTPATQQSFSKEELLKQVNPEINPNEFSNFTKLVKDDIELVRQLIENIDMSEQPAKDIKRMRVKRSMLYKKEDATAEDWDALSDEYESLEFTANAANCRRRARRLQKRRWRYMTCASSHCRHQRTIASETRSRTA